MLVHYLSETYIFRSKLPFLKIVTKRFKVHLMKPLIFTWLFKFYWIFKCKMLGKHYCDVDFYCFHTKNGYFINFFRWFRHLQRYNWTIFQPGCQENRGKASVQGISGSDSSESVCYNFFHSIFCLLLLFSL